MINLANAQNMLLKNPTDSMRKIEAQEAADYDKSKSQCLARVKMTAEQATLAEKTE